LRFVVDECISFRIARALSHLRGPEHTVVAIEEVFGEKGAKDTMWLRQLGTDDAAVTQDERILTAHRAIVLEVKPRLIVFDGGAWGNINLHERTWRMVRYWPDVETAAKEGGCHLVSINGKVRRWSRKR
jgi:hypothetical protein